MCYEGKCSGCKEAISWVRAQKVENQKTNKCWVIGCTETAFHFNNNPNYCYKHSDRLIKS